MPTDLPAATSKRTHGRLPSQMTVGMPAAIMPRAARTLEDMPPVPKDEEESPATAEMERSTCVTSGMSVAVGSTDGLAV